jgi:hypothetical protein
MSSYAVLPLLVIAPSCLRLQLVDLGFNVKKLYALQTAIDQPGDAVEKSQAKNVLIEKEQERRTRNRE